MSQSNSVNEIRLSDCAILFIALFLALSTSGTIELVRLTEQILAKLTKKDEFFTGRVIVQLMIRLSRRAYAISYSRMPQSLDRRNT